MPNICRVDFVNIRNCSFSIVPLFPLAACNFILAIGNYCRHWLLDLQSIHRSKFKGFQMTLFAVSEMITPLELGVAIFAGLTFLITFVIASAGGGFQDLVKTTLDNDEARRNQRKPK